jgi:hypothetical protein
VSVEHQLWTGLASCTGCTGLSFYRYVAELLLLVINGTCIWQLPTSMEGTCASIDIAVSTFAEKASLLAACLSVKCSVRNVANLTACNIDFGVEWRR